MKHFDSFYSDPKRFFCLACGFHAEEAGDCPVCADGLIYHTLIRGSIIF